MSPIDCEDQELLEGFLSETAELLEKLDDDLVALGKFLKVGLRRSQKNPTANACMARLDARRVNR